MVTLIATEDAYVSLYNPSINYGSHEQIRTEYWDAINEIGYIKFDLSQYSSSDILSAKLRLYINYNPVGTAYRTLEFRRVTGSWSEGGITWNNKPSQTQDGALILE
ncbi:MAG: DNRLRE domain-containing protein, partial [ANME-2 cluster archaeon]